MKYWCETCKRWLTAGAADNHATLDGHSVVEKLK